MSDCSMCLNIYTFSHMNGNYVRESPWNNLIEEGPMKIGEVVSEPEQNICRKYYQVSVSGDDPFRWRNL